MDNGYATDDEEHELGVRCVAANVQHPLADTHAHLTWPSFTDRRLELLQARADRYDEMAAGGTLDFLADTQTIRLLIALVHGSVFAMKWMRNTVKGLTERLSKPFLGMLPGFRLRGKP